MPETFMDRRRNMLRDLIKSYGGKPDEAQKYLDMWLKGQLRQVEVEIIVAYAHGATTAEVAEQFGYKKPEFARAIYREAMRKVAEHGG